MDGHECKEIMFSQLERTNRLDSEFYKKKSLKIVELLKSMHAKPLTDCVNVSDGNHMGISDKFIDSGIPYYRGQDMHNFFIEDADPVCIDEETFNGSCMKRSHLKKNDILLSIVGTIGEVALVSKDEKATCNCKIAILRPFDEKKAALTAVYLKTRYGFDQVDKFKRGAVQMGYLLEDMNQILIPDFSPEMADVVARAVESVKTLNNKSNAQYALAEDYLLKEIGVDMSSIANGGVSENFFSECFNVENRIDAEFYQHKYDEMIDAILLYDSEAKSIDEIAEYVFTGECAEEYFEYQSGLQHFIRGTDIHNGSVNVNAEYSVESDKHSKFVSTGDIITGRVGTIGNFGVISEELDASVCSDNVLCFHLPNGYIPNVYALYFNSAVIKELTNRMSRGSVQQRLNQETLRGLLVPYINETIQKEIDAKIRKSFSLKEKSENLLECAKQAVEIAIDQDEITAIEWLETKINELEVENTELQIIDTDFTLCKVSDLTQIDLSQKYVFIGKTDEEISVVCPADKVPDHTLAREDGWRAFRIKGTLDFSLVGVLAKIAGILAGQKIGIFAISTYNTDYILTKAENLERALNALLAAGYEITG